MAKDGSLLVMNAVLRVARAAVLMQCKAHYFPARSTSSCDKHAEERDKEFGTALTEGYSRPKS